MYKVVEYNVLSNQSLPDLIIAVNNELKNGWHLKGAMIHSYHETRNNYIWGYHQTMVKYSSDPYLETTPVTEFLES